MIVAKHLIKMDATEENIKMEKTMGKLIVFEGIDGAGKTTQIKLLAEWLNQTLISPKVAMTQQPGGTLLGNRIREILLNPDLDICDRAELLLFAADRAEHCHQIKRWLNDGAIVLCDRFTASTVAYQGYGMGINLELMSRINLISTNGLKPDLTIWLDLDVETALSRMSGNDRIEKRGLEFFKRVHYGMSLCQKCDSEREPEKHYIIDARNSVDAIAAEIREFVKTAIN